jgi:hypothetical protein
MGQWPPTGLLVVTNSGTVTTNFFDWVLIKGDYIVNTLWGKVYVQGNTRLVVLNGIALTGSDALQIGPSGSLRVYAGGTNCVLGGNGVINQSGFASNCQLYFTPSVTSVSFKGNGQFIGTIFAPEAIATLNGAGAGTSDFIGSLIAQAVIFNGQFNFHFDEGLEQTSAQLSSPKLGTGAQFSFGATGVPGFNYIVKASTNLTSWVPLATNASPFSFTDFSSSNFPHRFYRAVRPH